MPYFWESSKWIERLQKLGITPPAPSGLLFDQMYKAESIFMSQMDDLMKEKFKLLKGTNEHLAIWLSDGINKTFPKTITTDIIFPLLEEISRILQVKDGESIVEKMLTTPGIGRVRNVGDGRQLAIEQFFSTISKQLVDISFDCVCIGSMEEKCRCGYADEFDYRLDLNISLGYAPQKYDLERFKDYVNSNSILNNFYPSICIILNGLVSTYIESSLQFLGYSFNTCGVLYLIFKWQGTILIKVDCVPAIACPGIWLNPQKYDPLGDEIEPISHVILCYREEQLHPTWSVCAAEQQTMARLPDYVKDGYVLAKILFGPSLLGHQGSLLGTFSSSLCPSSYFLKNSLFMAIASGDVKIDYNQQLDHSQHSAFETHSTDPLLYINRSHGNNNGCEVELAMAVTFSIIEKLGKEETHQFFLCKNLIHEKGFWFKAISAKLPYSMLQELEKQHKSRRVIQLHPVESVDRSPIYQLVHNFFHDAHGMFIRPANVDDVSQSRLEKELYNNFLSNVETYVSSPANGDEFMKAVLQLFLNTTKSDLSKDCEIDLD